MYLGSLNLQFPPIYISTHLGSPVSVFLCCAFILDLISTDSAHTDLPQQERIYCSYSFDVLLRVRDSHRGFLRVSLHPRSKRTTKAPRTGFENRDLTVLQYLKLRHSEVRELGFMQKTVDPR